MTELTNSQEIETVESPAYSRRLSPNQQNRRRRLPDQPLITLEAGSSWSPLNLREVWAYRELLYFLTWRDLKLRYKQTVIGVAWVVLQPLLTTLVFTVFLGRLARIPSDGIPYPLFAYAGLLPWTFFSYAVGSSSSSVVGSANLITKVYFPRIIIPAAAVAARLSDFAISLVILFGLTFYYRVQVSGNIWVLPFLLVLTTFFALGVGMFTAAVNVRYRDVGVVLPVVIQLWMFLSPIVYPSSLVPPQWQRIYSLNPLVGIIEGFRAAVFGRELNWLALGVSTIFTACLLIFAGYAFRRMEKSFADVV